MTSQTRSNPATRWLIALAAIFVVVGAVAIIALLIFVGDAKRDAAGKPGATDSAAAELILTPVVAPDDSISGEDLEQSLESIRQRLEKFGIDDAVAELSSGEQIVITFTQMPDKNVVQLLETRVRLNLRPVLLASEPGGSLDIEADGADWGASGSKPRDASDLAWISEELVAEFNALDCGSVGTSDEHADSDAGSTAGLGVDTAADPDTPMAACDSTGYEKYILGPSELAGGNIVSTEAFEIEIPDAEPSDNAQEQEWALTVEWDEEGATALSELSRRVMTLESPRDRVAIVLEGTVLSAPRIASETLGGSVQMSGNFTQEEARLLAAQLGAGESPLAFTSELKELGHGALEPSRTSE